MFGVRAMKRFLLLVGIAVFLLAAVFNGMVQSADKTEHIQIVVEEGDTLWRIAQKYYDDSHDKRSIIDDIKAHNHLSDATIQPGDILLIPK